VVDLTDEERQSLDLKGGVKVTESSDAGASAGIVTDDIVLTIGNVDVTSANQFVKLASQAQAGKPLGMMVQRSGQTQWILLKPKK